jgi:hypothetical protein
MQPGQHFPLLFLTMLPSGAAGQQQQQQQKQQQQM